MIVALGFFPSVILDYTSGSVDDLVSRLDPSTTAATKD
jgi:hypothetical protein